MKKKEQKRPLNCEKNLPIRGKTWPKLLPHGEKGSKKAFNDETSPPWGDKRSNKAPFLFHNLYTTANAIYQLDNIFVLASHSTNIFLLFYTPPHFVADIRLSFFHFLGGQSPLPIPTHPLPPWTSACPPTLFHFACIVYRSPPLISLVKHR